MDVMSTSGMPQATAQPHGVRSPSTLRANPWLVTPRLCRMPIETIFRPVSIVHTPVSSSEPGGVSRRSAGTPSAPSAATSLSSTSRT